MIQDRPDRRVPVACWIAAIILFAFSGGLRAYKLGAWSYSSDEAYTHLEVETMDEPQRFDPHLSTIPRVIPLAFHLHRFAIASFGRSEFGTRLLPAFLGTLSIPILVVLLWRPLGSTVAIATGAILAIWPEHLFQSQQHRYYAIAWFFASLGLAVGFSAAVDGSLRRWLIACALGWLAVLCHTMCAPIFAIFLMAELAKWPFDRAKFNWKSVAIIGGNAIGVATYYVLRIRPLVGEFRSNEEWAYDPIRALFGAVQMIGWPTFLIAAFGWMLLIHRRDVRSVYWCIAAAVWLSLSAVLPYFVSFHTAYVFPLALAAIVPAGVAIAEVYAWLRPKSLGLALAAVALALAAPLPSLLSYAIDGGRYDYRSACQYVMQRKQPGETIAGHNKTVLDYYCGESTISAYGRLGYEELAEAAKKPGRIWIIVTESRRPIDDELAAWLPKNAIKVARFRKPRYDYYEYCVDVYLSEVRRPDR